MYPDDESPSDVQFEINRGRVIATPGNGRMFVFQVRPNYRLLAAVCFVSGGERGRDEAEKSHFGGPT